MATTASMGVADHGEQLRLGLVDSLRGFPREALFRQPVDKTLDLREQIVGPKVLRSHYHFSRPGFQNRTPGSQT